MSQEDNKLALSRRRLLGSTTAAAAVAGAAGAGVLGLADGTTTPAAAQAARGNGAWVPPTLALALWTLGRRDEAVQWYAAAVRTEPQLWNDPSRLAQLLPAWKDEERARLAEVQQAWAANPPAWP